MQKNRKVEIRVGIFVLTSLLIGGALVFAVGGRRNVFSMKTTYLAVFDDVSGLRPGGPIHMGGVNVGSVGKVELQKNGEIKVQLYIVDDVTHLIRTDSLATIGSKGMLGDRLVAITAGSQNKKNIPPGGSIPTQTGGDAFEALKELGHKAGPILESAKNIAQNIESATEPLADPEFKKDIKNTAHHLSAILGYVAEGNGFANRLFTDKALADSMQQSIGNVKQATQELSLTLASVRSIVSEVEHGSGGGHELIYGKDGKRLVDNLANATGELSMLMHDVRTTDSTVHDLFYGNKADDFLKNITAISEDFKVISHDMRDGKGTLGGLLVDPSLYEDLKRLVGNLERNEVLRALVRYSIKQDEERGALKIKEKAD
ncbi:MAG: MCE family protein [Myxococcales bacterium]|nr:MAG: MCE family protein [Myxococcales bacterium]